MIHARAFQNENQNLKIIPQKIGREKINQIGLTPS